MGGENDNEAQQAATLAGSSPRGRGKLSIDTTLPATDGLIPAWAGKTHGPGWLFPGAEAHPRVGGENPI